MIWGDYCPTIANNIAANKAGNTAGFDLAACKASCVATTGCAVINFRPDGACVLKKCVRVLGTGLVPPPIEFKKGWTGYALQDYKDKMPIIGKILKGVDTVKSDVHNDIIKVKTFGDTVRGAMKAVFKPGKAPRDPNLPPAPVPVPVPAPAPTPSVESPSPSPPVPHGSSTWAPTKAPDLGPNAPVLCNSPANSNSGCRSIGGANEGKTLATCTVLMRSLGGDTFNFDAVKGQCYVKKCFSPFMQYQSNGKWDVYSVFCQAKYLRAINPAPPAVVGKYKNERTQPETALGSRHQPWFPSWVATMLWVSIPSMIGMVYMYRSTAAFRSCRHLESRSTRFAFNEHEASHSSHLRDVAGGDDDDVDLLPLDPME